MFSFCLINNQVYAMVHMESAVAINTNLVHSCYFLEFSLTQPLKTYHPKRNVLFQHFPTTCIFQGLLQKNFRRAVILCNFQGLLGPNVAIFTFPWEIPKVVRWCWLVGSNGISSLHSRNFCQKEFHLYKYVCNINYSRLTHQLVERLIYGVYSIHNIYMLYYCAF